jgi:DNA-binding PadR family transcriptional regulator
MRSYIRLKILDLLSREPMHGYAIMKKLEEELGFRLSPGMLYPILREMLGMGLVASSRSGGGSRRVIVYEITQQGREFLERSREDVESFERRLRRVKYCGLSVLIVRLRAILRNIDRLSDSDLDRLRKAVSSFLDETRGLGV